MLDRLQRLFRHRWFDANSVRRALPPAALQRLQDQVQASERLHSGEIRLCIEAGLPASYLWRQASTAQIIRQRAVTLFGKLRVWDTEHNNGVLIYLLLAERAIEVVADRGINRHVSPAQWQAMIAQMQAAFRAGQFEVGLNKAIAEISALLTAHFPTSDQASNPNELPDAPVLEN